MLLILQGGAGNADGSEDLANQLAERFTVVTYDCRGLSRSAPIRAGGYEIAAHSDGWVMDRFRSLFPVREALITAYGLLQQTNDAIPLL